MQSQMNTFCLQFLSKKGCFPIVVVGSRNSLVDRIVSTFSERKEWSHTRRSRVNLAVEMGTYCCRNGQLQLSKWESIVYIWRSKWAPNAVEMDTAALVRTEKKLEGPPSSLTFRQLSKCLRPLFFCRNVPESLERFSIRANVKWLAEKPLSS